MFKTIFCWALLAGLAFAAPTTDDLVFVGPDVDEMGNPSTAVYHVHADGSGREKVTAAGRYQRPCVSSVGAKLLFNDAPMLHVCDWDGGNRVNIRPVAREHFLPAWSPDGRQVAFASDLTNDAEIWLMAADGADARNLTWYATSADLDPAWSPDGRHLAFISTRGGGYRLYVMDMQTQDVRTLAGDLADARYPAWSPDGRTIAVGNNRAGNWDIFTVDVPTGTVTPLVESPAWDGQPAWDATGGRLAFVSDRAGTADVWILDIVSGNLRNLTATDDADETWPAWVPTQIAAAPLPIAEARLSTLDLPRPRMLFTPETLPAIRQRLAAAPYVEARDAFLARCDAFLDPESAAGTQLRASIAEIPQKLVWSMPWQDGLMELAFAYQLTGDEKYGRTAVPLFLEVLDLLRKHHQQPLLGLWKYRPDRAACTYDWLHGLFTPADNDAICTFFATSCASSYAGTMTTPLGLGPGWEERGGQSNFAVFMAYAVGAPAIALVGEKQFNPNWLAMGAKILELLANRWFDDNGACRESSAYFTWPLEGTMAYLVTMNDLGLTDCLRTGKIANWPTWYAASSGNGLRMMVNTGDAYNVPPHVPLGFLRLYADNPLVDLVYARGGNPAAPEAKVESLLWWRPVDPRPEATAELARAVVFRAPSYAIMRSGYGDDDPLLLLAAAARSGHAHCETGAVQLYGYGASFVVNTGYGDPFPQSHSQVLVNGQGRPFPLADAQHDIWPGLVSGAFGAGMKVECTPFFAGRAEGHLDYKVPLPGYPVRRYVRYGAMVAAGDGVPPYFLLYDDVDRNGQPNRYAAQFITERGRDFVTDGKATRLDALYTGPHFVATGPQPANGIVRWMAAVPAGEYRCWLFIRNDGRSMYRLVLDGQSVAAGTGPQSLTEGQWQWRPLAMNKDQAPLALELAAGTHEFRFLAPAYQHIPQSTLAKLLLVPAANEDYVPFAAAAADAPAGSVLLDAAAAEVQGQGWERVEGSPAPATTLIAALGTAPATFTTGFHTMRTKHGARDANLYRRLRIERDAVNPRFTTLLYPYRDGMLVPEIARVAAGDSVLATLTWPDAVDTIVSGPVGQVRDVGGVRTDAALVVVRRPAAGATSWLLLDGTTLTVDGKDVMTNTDPAFRVSR